MKRLIISLAIIITGFCAFSQQMEFDWITQAGGPGWDIVTDINELPNGNLAVVGTFYESINFPNDTLYSKGSRDIFIAKYAPDGSLQQLTSIGGQGYDYVKTLEIFGENELILPIKFYQDLEISGKTFESNFSNNFLISWLDQNLTLTNSFLLGSTKEFDISSIQAEPDGGCLFTGWFSDTLMVENIVYEAKAEKDIFVGKLNANGGLLWLKHFQGEGNDIATNIISTPENVSLLIGTTTKGCFDVENNPKFKGDKYTHIFLVELDSLGNTQTISYPFSGVEIEPVDALVDSNSVLFLANIKNPVYTARNEKISPIENSDILLIKVDRNSQETEYFLLGGTSNDLADGLIKSGENILVTGLF
ncbi:hypothetical protein SLH46_21585, partial [Draconibacterium sp. IB214405]|uniref:hypothetical protein n=1 Tax=Draconibacterium sp. IB214405 TaxID=3097352 RepID=UPI002A13CFED